MKKRLFICLTLVLLVALLVGCKGEKYKLPHDRFCYSLFTSSVIGIQLEDKEYIIDLLNGAEWENGITECGCEYVFYTQNQEVRYYSVSGTFNDVTDKKTMTVSEEQRSAVNAILGVKTNTHTAQVINTAGWIMLATGEGGVLDSRIGFDPLTHTFAASNGALSSIAGIMGDYEVDKNTVICRSQSKTEGVKGEILFTLTREGDTLITQDGKKVYRAASAEALDKLMATGQGEGQE